MSQGLLRTIRKVMRTQVRTVVRLTTGPLATIQVVADGYVRTDAGSFLTDDWCANDEITGVGFPDAANNLPRQVANVVANKLTVSLGSSGALVPTAIGPSVSVRAALPFLSQLERRDWSKPDVTRCYWREALLPAMARANTIGPRKRIENRGIYQITLLYPSNFGAAAQDAMGEAIITAFYPGLLLTANGLNVNIVSAVPSPAIPDSGFSALPISIGYKVFTITPQ